MRRDDCLLCAVTDRAWLATDDKTNDKLATQVARAIAGGATMIQLREKSLAPEKIAEAARVLLAVTKSAGVPLIVNDSLEAALASGADGLHIGQGDGDPSRARAALGEGKTLGVSVRTVAQALAAERAGADYLGVGAMFPTASKDDALPVDRLELAEICSAVRIPVIAIGGIDALNAPSLAGTGITGVAAISAVFSRGENIESATRELRQASEIAVARESAVALERAKTDAR